MVLPDCEESGSHKSGLPWRLQVVLLLITITNNQHVSHTKILYICVGYMLIICNGKEQQLTTCSLPESTFSTVYGHGGCMLLSFFLAIFFFDFFSNISLFMSFFYSHNFATFCCFTCRLCHGGHKICCHSITCLTLPMQFTERVLFYSSFDTLILNLFHSFAADVIPLLSKFTFHCSLSKLSTRRFGVVYRLIITKKN